jgi:NADH-quinone oxidoreductase subunit G
VIVAGPENNSVFSDLNSKINVLAQTTELVWLTAAKTENLDLVATSTYQIPLKTFIEKDGTYVNFSGIVQKVKRATTIVAGALTLEEAVNLMSGKELDFNLRPVAPHHLKTNFLIQQRGTL